MERAKLLRILAATCLLVSTAKASSLDLTLGGDLYELTGSAPYPQSGIAPETPANLGLGYVYSNAGTFVYQESSGVTLGSGLFVDNGGENGAYTRGSQLAGATLPAGSVGLDSFLIHISPKPNSSGAPYPTTKAYSYAGSVTFPDTVEIVGVILTDSSLDASDEILGNPGTSYYAGTARSFDLAPNCVASVSCDSFTISGDTLSFTASTEVMNEMRIVTEDVAATNGPATPEPAMFLPGAFTILAFGLRRWKGGNRKAG